MTMHGPVNVKLAVTVFLTLNIKMNTYVTLIFITLSHPQEVYACRTYSGTPVFILNSPISAVSYFVVRRPFVDDSFTFCLIFFLLPKLSSY